VFEFSLNICIEALGSTAGSMTYGFNHVMVNNMSFDRWPMVVLVVLVPSRVVLIGLKSLSSKVEQTIEGER
jgi:hypothetical protein